jgi:hypothetical protein
VLVSGRFTGRKHHNHIAAFNARFPFDCPAFFNPARNLLQYGLAVLLESHFTAAKNDIDFYAVTAIEKLKHVPHFDFKVVLAGERPQFDFLGLHGVDGLAFLQLFALLILELSIIHQPAHRRIGIGGNFNKIEALFNGNRLSLLIGYDAELVAFAVDDPQERGLDGGIDPGLAVVIFLFYGCILRIRYVCMFNASSAARCGIPAAAG